MKDKVQVHLKTYTVEDTQQFGKLLGAWVKQNGDPLCIALVGDLGTGKTHLSQGIAKGFGVTEEITSPTFAIMNEYEGRLPLYLIYIILTYIAWKILVNWKILAFMSIQKIAYPL